MEACEVPEELSSKFPGVFAFRVTCGVDQVLLGATEEADRTAWIKVCAGERAKRQERTRKETERGDKREERKGGRE